MIYTTTMMNPSDTDNSEVDRITTHIFDNHPEHDVNEIEFSITGSGNRSSPWNMGIAKFRQLLTGLHKLNGLKTDPQREIMLSVYAPSLDARVRIEDPEEIQRFCRENNPPISHPKITYERKVRHLAIDMEEFGLRLRFSSENPIEDPEERKAIVAVLRDDKKTNNKFYRYAQRYSIISPTKIGRSGGLRVDFTSVRQGHGYDFRSAQLTGPGSMEHDRYEVEVELSGLTRAEIIENADLIKTEMRLYLGFLLRGLRGGMAIEPASETLASLNKYLRAINISLGRPKLPPISDLYQPTMIKLAPSFVTVNITTMNMSHVTNDEHGHSKLFGSGDGIRDPIYAFTDKADGLRSLLFIDETGKASIIIRSTIKPVQIMKNGKERQSPDLEDILEVWPTGLKYEFTNEADKTPFLLDGEFLWIQNKRPYFLIFDVLIHRGQKKTNTDFEDRINMFKTAFNKQNDTGLSVQGKEFFTYLIDTFKEFRATKLTTTMEAHQLVDLKFKALGGLEYKLDGLIFQPLKNKESFFPLEKKTWKDVFKWKPSYMATLDLRLQHDGLIAPREFTKTYEDGEFSRTVRYAEFEAFANGTPTASNFKCCAKVFDGGVPRTEPEDGSSLGEPIRKGMIVECRLSLENVGTGDYHWVPIRVRHDKSKPNHVEVYNDLINTLLNSPISLENLSIKGGGRGGSKSVLVNTVNRNISNRVIETEISERIPGNSKISLLDLGCGTLKSGMAWYNLAKERDVRVLGVDICDIGTAKISLREFMAKFKSRLKAELVYGNFNQDLATQTQTMPLLIKGGQFNVVTCTFAIHYSMATEDSFRSFVHNVSRNLAEGGLFIGSYMNKRLILSDINKSAGAGGGGSGSEVGVQGNVTENSRRKLVWELKLVNSEDAERLTFGAAMEVSFPELYDKHLEYLINLEDAEVQRILAEEGLILKKHEPYNGYEDEARKLTVDIEKQWLSYHYMFVFEKSKPVAKAIQIKTTEPEPPTELAPAPAPIEPAKPVKRRRTASSQAPQVPDAKQPRVEETSLPVAEEKPVAVAAKKVTVLSKTKIAPVKTPAPVEVKVPAETPPVPVEVKIDTPPAPVEVKIDTPPVPVEAPKAAAAAPTKPHVNLKPRPKITRKE
jgi:SAM-dependent methyltransferase